MSYFSAKIIGEIFSNPPYHIVRCIVASEVGTEPIVVKGNLVGPSTRGTVFTFSGKKKIDKKNKPVLEITRSPINPKFLKGTALSQWADWSSPSMQESIELISDLSSSGVPTFVLNDLWGDLENNISKIKENPWLLLYKGVSLANSDQIAKTLLKENFRLDSTDRIEACVFNSLLQGVNQGNCYLDSATVFRDVKLMTGVENLKLIADAIKNMVRSSPPRISVSKNEKGKSLYMPAYRQMEQDTSDLIKSPDRVNSKINISDEEVRKYTRYELTGHQIRAIKQGLTSPFSIVTGLPGTGKTTILSTICKILSDFNEDVLLVAPTGIAAKRASSLSGIKAYTIHRAMGAGQPIGKEDREEGDYEGVKKTEDEPTKIKPIYSKVDPRSGIWKFNPKNPRVESVLIVDESSMVDLHLMWRLMSGISLKCRVIMVGDIAQLPPVGAGFVLSELIESNAIPRVHLTEVFRQGEGSGVVEAAHKVHDGVEPTANGEFHFKDQSEDESLQSIISLCREFQFEDIDFHVISPTHHGKLGVTNLNKHLRSALNPDIGGPSIKVGKNTLREGDRVMITKNDYDLGVYNGDVGKISKVDRSHVEVFIRGVKDEIISVPRDQISKILRLAYCTTVHKSQGLEYSKIIMPMVDSFSANLLKRSLLYTAITRAREEVFIFGDLSAISRCVHSVGSTVGFCGLSYRVKFK